MAELSRTMLALLDAITLVGSKWVPQGSEGPRRIGYCCFCASFCKGVTTECETRVWNDARVSRK